MKRAKPAFCILWTWPAPPHCGHVRGEVPGAAPLPALGRAISLSRDGGTAAVGDDSGHLTLWDVAQKRLTRTVQASAGSIAAVAFNDAGDRLATVTEDGQLRIWKRDGTMVADKEAAATTVAYRPDGTLFVGRKDGQLGHRHPDGSPIASVPIFRGELITSVFVQPGGDTVTVAGKDGVSRFDVASGAILAVPPLVRTALWINSHRPRHTNR